MSLSERIYRLLLKAYPERYRRQYEAPMAQLFSDQLQAADTRRKLAALWLRTLADLLRTLPARHAEASPHIVLGIGNVGRFRYTPWSTPARRAVFFAAYEARASAAGLSPPKTCFSEFFVKTPRFKSWPVGRKRWWGCGGRLKLAN